MPVGSCEQAAADDRSCTSEQRADTGDDLIHAKGNLCARARDRAPIVVKLHGHPARVAETEARIKAQIEDAIAFGKESPFPDPATQQDGVFSDG